MRIGGPPQRTVHPTDIAMLAARVAGIAKRLCEVETWRRLAQGNADDRADDIIKLEERVDAQAETIAAQAERIVRLELLLGVAIQRRDVEG